MELKELKELGISFGLGDGEKLLPYTYLCREEFEIINAAVGVTDSYAWTKILDISIGKGITYKLMHHNKYQELEIILHSQDNFFALPLKATVVISHEPEGEEHSEWCPYYPHQIWEKDEEGFDYILDPNGDPWYADNFDCQCDYVKDSQIEIVCEDDLSPLTSFLEEMEQ